MDGIRVPPNARWFQEGCGASTPNGGFVYVNSKSYFSYIGPRDETCGGKRNIQIIPYTKSVIDAIDCDPDWSDTKYVATFDCSQNVYVWDMDRLLVVKGHKFHVSKSDEGRRSGRRNQQFHVSSGGVLCFLPSRDVLSTFRGEFFRFCVASNTVTHVALSNNIFEREHINIMVPSPYANDIVAIGTKRGLVAIVNITERSLLYRLRGHDRTITSLEWMQINPPAAAVAIDEERRPQLQARSKERKLRGPPKPIVGDDDIFDIHEYDDGDEFGATSRPPLASIVVGPPPPPAPPSNDTIPDIVDHMDFMETCQKLKEDILLGLCSATNLNDVSIVETETQPQPAVEETQPQLLVPLDQTIMAETSFTTDDTEDGGDDDDGGSSQATSVELEIEKLAKKQCGPIVFLATASSETHIWIWNTMTGTAEHKIELPRSRKTVTAPFVHTTLVWINETTMITNTPTFDMISYEITTTNNFKIKSKQKPDTFEQYTGVAELYKCRPATDDAPPCFWSSSTTKQLILTRYSDVPEIVDYFSTTSLGMGACQVSPHDSSKVAFGGTGRRISILNLSNFRPNNIQIDGYQNQVQAKVLCLAWHPDKENLLAFSTEEGRVGIYDVSKPCNLPKLMKPFTGKGVYQLSWAKIGTESYAAAEPTNSTESSPPPSTRTVLLATSCGMLVYFPETGDSKCSAIPIKMETSITAVCANQTYMALGSEDGYILVQPLHNIKRVLWSKKICSKYVSECTWSSVRVSQLAATCSADGIFLFDCISDSDIGISGELVGHKGVASAKWSCESANRLVSAGFDGSVRVWDTKALTCTALYQYDCQMFIALFLPSDENYVLCSGQMETLHIFDTRLHMHEAKNLGKRPPKIYADEFQWARIVVDAQKMLAIETKQNRRNRKTGEEPSSSSSAAATTTTITTSTTDHINGAMEQLHLNGNGGGDGDGIIVPAKNATMTFLSIFQLSSKEFTARAEEMLAAYTTNPNGENGMSSGLFSTKERAKELLNLELANHKRMKSPSVAYELVPQLTGDLKAHIELQIKNNELNERLVSLAPMVSYSFWKLCCVEYAKQLITNNCALSAVPYLMASYNENDAINALCKANYYREAWVIAKLNKEDETDAIFLDIANRWEAHLIKKGMYETAALLLLYLKKPQRALQVLYSRNRPSPEVLAVISYLSEIPNV